MWQAGTHKSSLTLTVTLTVTLTLSLTHNPNPNQVGAAYSSSYTKDPIAEALGVIRLGVRG